MKLLVALKEKDREGKKNDDVCLLANNTFLFAFLFL